MQLSPKNLIKEVMLGSSLRIGIYERYSSSTSSPVVLSLLLILRIDSPQPFPRANQCRARVTNATDVHMFLGVGVMQEGEIKSVSRRAMTFINWN